MVNYLGFLFEQFNKFFIVSRQKRGGDFGDVFSTIKGLILNLQ